MDAVYDLVMEGGGAKGMAFVGAVQYMEEEGIGYGRLLGTSAGAITAALLAAAYTAEEMQAALSEKESGQPVFAGFLGTPPPFTKEEIQASALRDFLRSLDLPFVPGFLEDRVDDAINDALLRWPAHRNVYAFVERGGWFSADKFLEWMAKKLDEGTYKGTGPHKGKPRAFSKMTLAEFHAATERDLSVVVSDTTAGRIRVLNHRTAPNCPLLWAVRMSMSIPLVWQEVTWLGDWDAYLTKSALRDSIMVDGGMLSNFPLELFLSREKYVIDLMGEPTAGRVLGLLLDDGLALPGDPPAPETSAGGLDLMKLRSVQRVLRLVNTMMTAHDKLVLDNYEHLVVRLPAKGYGAVDFGMSDEKRDRLVKAGYDATKAWFERPRPAGDAASGAAAVAQAQGHADRIARDILQP
jgi:predicted acylesterase/phospholipase RssA